MASYHLNVMPVSRAQGRSATACAAYRAAERIDCAREGRCHDYTRKSGVRHAEIVAPANAPDWVRDRSALWNGAEASEKRKNSVVAREWRVALPAELAEAERRELALDFAHALVERFGVAADVAIHAPDREGDARNHHAHILTTTRRIGPEGFAEKTRELDDRKRGSAEIAAMRALWAARQNFFLERAGAEDRVDHRSLEAQRAEAEAERDRLAEQVAQVREPERGAPETSQPAPPPSDAERLRAILEQRAGGRAESGGEREGESASAALATAHAAAVLRAEALDRAPEIKLGPAANAIERAEQRAAAREGRAYEPRTERGAQVHEARQARALFAEMRQRLERARAAYANERARGQDRISAGLEAIRAAASRERGAATQEDIAARLAGIVERGRGTAPPERAEAREERRSPGPSIEARLSALREPRHAAPKRAPPDRSRDAGNAERKPGRTRDIDRDDGLDR